MSNKTGSGKTRALGLLKAWLTSRTSGRLLFGLISSPVGVALTLFGSAPIVLLSVSVFAQDTQPVNAQPANTQAANTQPASARVDAAWLERSAQRAEQIERVLLSAMSAARDERQSQLAACFDHALKELHSLQRQLSFHGDRALDLTLDHGARERHARALVLTNARLDYVAGSTMRCNHDGPRVKHAQTRVETTFER